MGGRSVTVLVVDADGERWRTALDAIYGGRARIDHAADEESALAALRCGRHDAALVAEQCGQSRGLELIREAVRAGYTVPLILVVNGSDRSWRQAARAAGAADCVLDGGRDADALDRALDGAVRQKHADAALRESEGRYLELFRALPLPSFVCDPDTLAFRDVNQAALALYGYSRDEFLSLNLKDIRPPECWPQLFDWIAKYRECRYVDAGVWRHRKKDGTDFDVEITSNALGTDGCRTRVVLVRDVTERQRADEVLRLSEERFRGAFDSAMIGMAIVAPDGRLIEVNDALCKFTGYSGSELLALKFQAITHPDDLDADMSYTHRLLAGEIDSYRMEKRYIHKRGHEVWGLLCVSAVRDAHGKAVFGVGMVEDITPRKRAEEAVARLLERLRRLRHLDEAILSSPSPREIAGTALDHLLQLLPCCYGCVDLRNTRRGRSIVLATRGADPGERGPGMGIRKSLTYKGRALGTLRLEFELTAVPAPEHREIAREVAGLLAIALGQARLFQQVRRGRRRLSALSERLIVAQEAERRRLARELHDEVGQSLTALKLTIQAGAEAADAAARKGLAEDGAALIDRLIQQVRNLSLDLRPSMLDDFGLVSALRWYVDGLARRSGIAARCTADPPDLRAPAAVETACFRIAQEALTNVVRHASARNVWVDLWRDGDILRMTIRDDGAGFDPSTAGERAARGAGLGLLGMRERAALLGGRIEIASSPGRGALVQLAIPLAQTVQSDSC